jgi:hypothetical protein
MFDKSNMSNWRVFPTPLSAAFFSPFNLEYLQKAIAADVKAKTGMNIDRQSDGDLSALMHRVYMRIMVNPDTTTQVKTLNEVVVQEASRQIRTNILQQLSYYDYISKAPVPLATPLSTSTHGNKMPSNDKYGF